MPRKREVDKTKYVDADEIKSVEPRDIDLVKLAYKVPSIVIKLGTSMVKHAEEKPDWKLYKIEIRNGVPFIVREMCDRCGKVWIPPRWRKIRRFVDSEIGEVFLETGVCKDCINASVYVDKYLDGIALTEKEAKATLVHYEEEYEKAWRIVLAQAPRIAITNAEWQHACEFFRGCAICGGPIEVQAKFFPRRFNGEHTAWNVIPLCENCLNKHYYGRLDISKPSSRYKIFSSSGMFQKTKTIRMYLMTRMEEHNLYIEPLRQWRKRFHESSTLNGAAMIDKEDDDSEE